MSPSTKTGIQKQDGYLETRRVFRDKTGIQKMCLKCHCTIFVCSSMQVHVENNPLYIKLKILKKYFISSIKILKKNYMVITYLTIVNPIIVIIQLFIIIIQEQFKNMTVKLQLNVFFVKLFQLLTICLNETRLFH